MLVDLSICLLAFTILISNSIYGLASPFLPTVLEEKEITSVWTGVIFSSYAVATIFTSLVVGKIIDSIGHNRIIMFGCFLMAVSIGCFGLIEGIVQNEQVIAISILLRLGQGKCIPQVIKFIGSLLTRMFSFKIRLCFWHN